MVPDPVTFAPDFREIRSRGYRFLWTGHHRGQQVAAHSHDRTTAMLLLQGELTETHGSHAYRLGPLDLVYKPPGVTHTNECPNGAYCFVVEFGQSPSWLQDETGTELRSDAWVGTGAAAAAALELYRLVFVSGDADALTIDEASTMFAAELAGRMHQRARVGAPAWLDRVRVRLLDSPEDRPSLRDLARIAGVHPAHLCRVFRAHHGKTIGEYARRVRVDRAVEIIRTSDTSMLAVGLQLGYFDQAHFTRDFRKFTGMPPGRFQRIVRARHDHANPVQDRDGIAR